MAFVHDLAFALGNRSCTVEDSARAGRTRSSAALLAEAGFRRHHLCNGESAYELAARAFRAVETDPASIDAILYSTCLPQNGNIGSLEAYAGSRDVKHLMDFPASHLQADFGMRARILGINQQACTGMLASLDLARLLVADGAERVLCLTADRFPEGALYEQSHNLISDGAAACIVSTEPRGFRLVTSHAITNGALARATDDEVVGSYFNYTDRLIRETLESAGLELRDIRWIVPQNMNVKAWEILSRVLGIDPARVYFETLPEIGHMISGDNLVNLKRLDEEGRIEPGDRLLLCMAGYGMTWQAVILEKH